MRNFDSVDATPLLLITIYRYVQKSGDKEFLKTVEPAVQLALDWLLKFGDSNNDGFIDYYRHPERTFGGLYTQSWMDSRESVFFESGEEVFFPVAPVEVQGYSYLALRLWSKHYQNHNLDRSEELRTRAEQLKSLFNQHFVLQNSDGFSLAFALDGLSRPMTSARSSMGHILWASLSESEDGVKDGILDQQYLPLLISRLMAGDLFEPFAGIRTLSTKSAQYSANSYHNGSIWPHDNSLIAEGLELWGFTDEAVKIRMGVFRALQFFGTPIELFVYDNGEFREYCSPTGQRACKQQAWSAASLLTASLSLRK
jgi:glycogen debranching enzyme